MFFRGFGYVLLCAVASAQVKPAAPSEKANTTVSKNQASAKVQTSKESAKPLSDPVVITIQGMCAKPAAKSDSPSTAGCKTTISRLEFEKVIRAIQPDTAPATQKQFADRYAMGLVMAHYAHEHGLDRGPEFEEMMRLMKIQAMSGEAVKELRSQASQISDKDIQAYYDKNAGNYQEADIERIYIPKTKQVAAKENQNPAELKKEREDSESEMKKEADALHSRAAAGEDFGKLQIEAFEAAGMKVQSPSTKLSKVRAVSFPPEQRSIFELNPGAVSNLITGPGGYLIYKLDGKTKLPLSSVRDDIHSTLQNQNFQNAMQAIQKSVQVSLDEQYFTGPSPSPQNALRGSGVHTAAPGAVAK